MRAAREMRRTHVKLALHRADECREQIEEQTAAGENDVTQVVLHQCAEHYGPQTILGSGAIDLAYGLFCLVNTRHKWQSDWPKFQSAKLREQAVPQRLGGHAGLIGHEENGSSAHGRGPQRVQRSGDECSIARAHQQAPFTCRGLP